jgi:hypothetical protein
MTDADEYEYPPEWAPPGAEPPERPNYAPPLRSGCPDNTGWHDEDERDAYPTSWGYHRR